MAQYYRMPYRVEESTPIPHPTSGINTTDFAVYRRQNGHARYYQIAVFNDRGNAFPDYLDINTAQARAYHAPISIRPTWRNTPITTAVDARLNATLHPAVLVLAPPRQHAIITPTGLVPPEA